MRRGWLKGNMENIGYWFFPISIFVHQPHHDDIYEDQYEYSHLHCNNLDDHVHQEHHDHHDDDDNTYVARLSLPCRALALCPSVHSRLCYMPCSGLQILAVLLLLYFDQVHSDQLDANISALDCLDDRNHLYTLAASYGARRPGGVRRPLTGNSCRENIKVRLFRSIVQISIKERDLNIYFAQCPGMTEKTYMCCRDKRLSLHDPNPLARALCCPDHLQDSGGGDGDGNGDGDDDDDDDDDDGVYLKAVNINLSANLQKIKSVNLKYL